MVNRRLGGLVIVGLASLSPFLIGQGCGSPVPAGGDSQGGQAATSPETLYEREFTEPMEWSGGFEFHPTATGRTIVVTVTSNNPKSDITLGISANTPEGGVRSYSAGTQMLGNAASVSFTSDFTLLHFVQYFDKGRLVNGAWTAEEVQNCRYTAKVVQQ